MLPTQFSQNVTLQEACEAKQINEELKRTEFDGPFCKKIQTSSRKVDFIHSFGKRRKSVGKIIIKRERGVTERPRYLNPGRV